MSALIVIPEELIKYSQGQKHVEVEASSIGTALAGLFEIYPDLKKRLVDEDQHFYPYVPAFLNDEKLTLRGAMNRRLQDGDQLAFMVVASGG